MDSYLACGTTTLETPISAERCKTDTERGFDSDEMATDTEQIRMTPVIRLSGQSGSISRLADELFGTATKGSFQVRRDNLSD